MSPPGVRCSSASSTRRATSRSPPFATDSSSIICSSTYLMDGRLRSTSSRIATDRTIIQYWASSRWAGRSGIGGALAAGLARHALIDVLDLVEILFLELFEIEQLVLGVADRSNDLVELYLNRFRVAVLRALDEEHHQEGDDGRAGVDDELPGVAEAKQGAGQRPHEHDAQRHHECRRAAGGVGRSFCEPSEPGPGFRRPHQLNASSHEEGR